MSDAETESAAAGEDDDAFDPERLGDLVSQVGDYVTALKRAIVDDEDATDVVDLAQDLWAVLEELEELLETIDLEELPEAIDVEKLPEAIDVEDVPEGLLDEDESVIDLGDVVQAVNLRELWDAVDLTQFLQEKRELETAIDDVGDADDHGDDDESDDELLENVVDTDGADVSFEQQARQQFVEEKIMAAVETFRAALLSTHDGLRKIYRENQEKLGQAGNQPDSLNPTARSTKPPGPLPDSISTRASTVPSQVRYSRADNPRRIFGRRFEEHHDDADVDPRTSGAADDASGSDTAVDDASTSDTANDEANTSDTANDEANTSDTANDDATPEIEVFDDNE
jgi:hypothetical protein